MLPDAVVGWDMSAALALGNALGVPPLAMAELLPVIEAVMVANLNEQMDQAMVEKRVSVRLPSAACPFDACSPDQAAAGFFIEGYAGGAVNWYEP